MTYIHATIEYWYHTFQVDLPKTLELSELPEICGREGNDNSNETLQCESVKRAIEHINYIKNNTVHTFEHFRSNIYELLPNSPLPHTGKHKRTVLMPWVSELGRFAFGFGKDEDVKKLASHIQALQDRQNLVLNEINHENQGFSSFMATADQRMTEAIKAIDFNEHAILSLKQEINFDFTKFTQLCSTISIFMADNVRISSILTKQIEDFSNGIIAMVNGKLTPKIIPPSILAHTIEAINVHLRKHYPKFAITHVNLLYYYQANTFKFLRHNDKIFITMKFPISAEPDPFKLFKVKSLPVPLNHSTDHASQILDLPDYFAISHDHLYYMILTEAQFLNCEGSNYVHCPMILPQIPMSRMQCITALFQQLRNEIKRFCNFRYLPHGTKPNIMQISRTELLVSNISSLFLSCLGEQKVVSGCQYCVMTLPCQCSITTNFYVIPPRLTNCLNSSNEITVLHPLNLGLLQYYFSDEILNDIHPSKMFTHLPDVSVPDFQIYEHNISAIIANDANYHLSL